MCLMFYKSSTCPMSRIHYFFCYFQASFMVNSNLWNYKDTFTYAEFDISNFHFSNVVFLYLI